MDPHSESHVSLELAAVLCRALVTLARKEEDAAAAEAASIPYWKPCSDSVVGHREAARTLRAEIARLEAESRASSLAS